MSSCGDAERASGSASPTSSSSPASLSPASRIERSGLAGRPRLARRRPYCEIETGILLEDRPLETLQGRAGVDAELLHQRMPRVLERLERLRLSPGAIQREHELSAEPLPERMRPHERLELAGQGRVSTAGEVGLDPLLERREA